MRQMWTEAFNVVVLVYVATDINKLYGVNGKTIVNDEGGRMQGEAVMSCFKFLSHNMCGGIGETTKIRVACLRA
jgi:hypothetical protein